MAIASDPILLVCGSRTLVELAGGKDWALGHIRSVASRGISALVSGDAPGPDEWARLEVPNLPSVLTAVFYFLDGTVRDWSRKPVGAWCRPENIPRRGTEEYRRWPLTRNIVMVRAVQQRTEQSGRESYALGLIDPESRTKGTEHTLGLCKRANFDGVLSERFQG